MTSDVSTAKPPGRGSGAGTPSAPGPPVLKPLSWLNVLDGMADSICLHDPSGRFHFVNRVLCDRLAYPREVILGMTFAQLLENSDAALFASCMETLVRDHALTHPISLRTQSGLLLQAECVSNLVAFNGAPMVVTVVRFSSDLASTTPPADRDPSPAAARSFYGESAATTDGFWITDFEGRILDVNEIYCRMVGLTRDEILSRRISDLEAEETPEEIQSRIVAIQRSGHDRFRRRHRRSDGSMIDVEVSVTLNREEQHFVVFLRDISDQILSERVRDLSFAIFEALNEPRDWRGALQVVVDLIRENLGFPVVALRLKDAEDFPYMAGGGLDATSFRQDCSLCRHDEVTDRLARSGDVDVRLACSCGMVLNGLTDRLPPHFTLEGTFWTNNLDASKPSLRAEDVRWFERDYCERQGFKSLALVPLGVGGEPLGLLQVADTTPDRFSLHLIHYLEGIGSAIGMAVARKRAEDGMTRYLKFQLSLLDRFPVLVWRSDRTGVVNYLNRTAREFLGLEGMVPSDGIMESIHPDDRARVAVARSRGIASRQGALTAYRLKHADGSWRPVSEHASPFSDINGDFAGLMAAVFDESAATIARGQLETSEERFRLLFDAMTEGIALLELIRDPNGVASDYRVIDVNPAFTRQTGFSRAAVVGQCARQNLGSAPYLRIFSDVVSSGASFSFEARIPAFDRDLRISAFALPEQRFGALVEDITERRNIERAVRRNEVMFREMVDRSPIAIQLFDRKGLLVHANGAARDIYGIPDPSDTDGYNLLKDDLVPQEALAQLNRGESTGFEVEIDFDARSERFHTMRRGRANFEIIITVLESMPMVTEREAVGPATDDVGPEGAFLVQTLDVSDRRKAEENMKRYEMLTSLARDIIFLLRLRDSRIVEVNHAALAAYGYSRDELLGLTVRDLRDPGAVPADWEHPLSDVRGFLYETVHARKDGTTFPVEVSATRINLDGERHLLAIVRDISERRRTEQTLLQTEKLAALGRLAAATAHEMNQPLNAIKNYCQGILLNIEERIPTTEQRLRQNLEGAVQQVDRMAEIIRNMRIFARQDEQGLRHPVSVQKVLVYPGTFLAAQFQSHGIYLEEELPAEDVVVLGNESRLQQVFINLMVNARDAIQERQDVRGGGQGTIRVRLATEDGMAVVSVSDDGLGISAEDRVRLFEPFFTTKGTERGTGLGLSISYEIIHQHGGTIRVEDAPGGGALFRVELPLWHETSGGDLGDGRSNAD